MVDDFGLHGGRSRPPWRVIGWGGAAGVLLLPWFADAPWTLFDFLLAGVLVGAAGLLTELTVRASGDIAYRAGAGVAVAAAAAFLLFPQARCKQHRLTASWQASRHRAPHPLQ